ncbi:MAG: ATP-binding cassette domain-containing protein [Proteobacteria bacterium]|nr:ATP-binding cassette domain-containing protein [Pseudomonadota bacterium]
MSVSSPHLRIDSLNLRLGKFQLRDIGLACEKGKYHILLGPSGSGKSSLIKCIMGFHRINSGHIYLGGKDITREIPERRGMGYVPQNYGLFPHLNAEENIRFGMKANKILKSEADSLVDRLCGMLGIEALRKRDVKNLSGGEQQKIALARALGTKPETILLDEPFSSIDEGGKHGLWFELKHIIDEVGITAIHITHNLEEAETLGEQLSVLINGELVQSGTRKEIFAGPANESIARYLNYRNIFKGVTRNTPDGTRVDIGNFSIAIREKQKEGETVTLCVRQQDIKIIKRDLPIKDELKRNVFNGVIVRLFPLLDYCQMWFQIEGSDKEYDFELKFPRHIKERYDLQPGKPIQVAIWEPKIIVL